MYEKKRLWNYYREYIPNNRYENNEWKKSIDHDRTNCFNNNIEIQMTHNEILIWKLIWEYVLSEWMCLRIKLKSFELFIQFVH